MAGEDIVSVKLDPSIRVSGLVGAGLDEFRTQVASKHGAGEEIAVLLPGKHAGAFELKAPYSDAADAFFARAAGFVRSWIPTARAFEIRCLDASKADLVKALANIYDAVVVLKPGVSGSTIHRVASARGSILHAPFGLLDEPVAFRKAEFLKACQDQVPSRSGATTQSLFLGDGRTTRYRTVSKLPETVWTRHPFLLIGVYEGGSERFVLVWNTIVGAIQRKIARNVATRTPLYFKATPTRLGSEVVLDPPVDDPWSKGPPPIVLDGLEDLVRKATGLDVVVLDSGLVRYWGRQRRPACVPSYEERRDLEGIASLARTGLQPDRRAAAGLAAPPPRMILVARELASPSVSHRDRNEAVLHEAAILVQDDDASSSAVWDLEARRTMAWACACALMNLRLGDREKIPGVDLVFLEADDDPDLVWWRARVGPSGEVGNVQTNLDGIASNFAPVSSAGGAFQEAVRSMMSAVGRNPAIGLVHDEFLKTQPAVRVSFGHRIALSA